MNVNDVLQEARRAGVEAGWVHANFVEGYGPDGVRETEPPAGYSPMKVAYWESGYVEGKELFANGRYVDGSPMG